jgi:glutathione peroxidase
MNHHGISRLWARWVGIATLLLGGYAWAGSCPAYLNHDFQKLHSSERVNICTAYAGRPLLIVNTASHCGFTPQFKGLESLHEQYKGRGLVVIGFPSDDFNQEAKDESETAQVCYVNYGVTFTMLSPQPVTGAAANPVFRELARQSHEPTWNFNKYLVKPDGIVTAYFDSNTTPESAAMHQSIEQLLAGTHGGG